MSDLERGVRATTMDEERVYVPCGDDFLSGVLTRPTVTPNGTTVVLYAGRWSVTSIGRSRLFVELARELAGLGFHSMRVDFLGLGESTGEEHEWDLEQLFSEEPSAVRAWLAERGLTDVWVAGTCGGARLALDSASHQDGVRGVVLMSPPVRNYRKGDRTATLPTQEFVKRALSKRVLAGLRDPRTRRRYRHHLRSKLRRSGPSARNAGASRREFSWVSQNFVHALEALVRRRVPVLLFFGEDDAAYDDFVRGREGHLGDILRHAGDLVSVVTVPGRFHGLSQADLHDLSGEAIRTWAPFAEVSGTAAVSDVGDP